ncbi:hypothetical protein MNEG_1817 [Monoraphidium neglectum]|uniref:Uncharacterized protein n=1 Tax=Monoraphidium neglectum TaxID=145388 RepID=A0A0D2N0T8_9CHLO|nr:hypothetical protein MNEG_1817 [Monoraphidium neglectum]KIZ06132.1 hypothetical protein MNEG_1817 [Monoraphidium neglectum]|eukprot:XP_013905151.1 hypothetical protein MNEG_1817 [Monoraphidium neglectum]
MRLCFAKPFVVDRPWRKPGDVIDKDKACPQVIGTVPISATNNTYTATWAVTKSTPKATWYAQVFVECKNGTATGFCQYDTSVNQTYVGTQIIESTPVSMKVAVALCSAIAPVFLAAFFIKEQVLKKKA